MCWGFQWTLHLLSKREFLIERNAPTIPARRRLPQPMAHALDSFPRPFTSGFGLRRHDTAFPNRVRHRPLRAHRVSRRLLREVPTSIFQLLTSCFRPSAFGPECFSFTPPSCHPGSDKNCPTKHFSGKTNLQNPSPFPTAATRHHFAPCATRRAIQSSRGAPRSRGSHLLTFFAQTVFVLPPLQHCPHATK